ncbi:MAG TPA: hypothetical protein VG844_02860 [Terracidiphilus sp.]|nr:hypothetical protein [Terracidiphilus sp.]
MKFHRIASISFVLLAGALCVPQAGWAQEHENHEADQALEVLSIDSKLIKDRPYSADTATDTVQALPDGNRIVHHYVSRFYRDAKGRTRREQTFGSIDPSHPTPHEVKVFIDDPVANTAYVLDPQEKTALELQRSRAFLDQRDAGGEPQVGKLPRLDETRAITKEDLGTKNIEGILCNGTRQTITIPAGKIGNERPIAIVTDTWFAPSLDVIVQSSTNDPRFGETTYQLRNIQVGRQALTFFEVPPGYRVEHPRQ